MAAVPISGFRIRRQNFLHFTFSYPSRPEQYFALFRSRMLHCCCCCLIMYARLVSDLSAGGVAGAATHSQFRAFRDSGSVTACSRRFSLVILVSRRASPVSLSLSLVKYSSVYCHRGVEDGILFYFSESCAVCLQTGCKVFTRTRGR